MGSAVTPAQDQGRCVQTPGELSPVGLGWGFSVSARGGLQSHNFTPLCTVSSLTPWSVHPICAHVLQKPPLPELPAGSKARGWGCTAPHRQPRSCPLITRWDRLPVTWEEVVCGMVAVMSRFRNVAMA